MLIIGLTQRHDLLQFRKLSHIFGKYNQRFLREKQSNNIIK